MNEETSVIVQTTHALGELSVREVQGQVAKIQECMKSLMEEGTHYGHSFPGDKKLNLLKPGADKLLFMFRLRADFEQTIKELDDGHREVTTHCYIFHIETGTKIAEGVGSCSTLESKYRWRNAVRKCPVCGAETIIKGKEEFGGGWLCYKNKGGCGAKFNDDDPKITKQTVGKVENTDIADTYNTVLKMSKKRAYVDATINACAASDIFTQDVEDIAPEEKPIEKKHEQQSQPPQEQNTNIPNTSPQSKQGLECPVCMKKTVYESKYKDKNGNTYWYCNERLGGCNARFGSLKEVIETSPLTFYDNEADEILHDRFGSDSSDDETVYEPF